MVLDSKLLRIKKHFNIYALTDWSRVAPRDLLAMDGIGHVTLDMVRMWLAARNLTLAGDQTPEFWKRNLSSAKISAQMAEEDIFVICDFTILVDSQEKVPFTFADICADADRDHRPMIVPVIWKSLGPGMGDYSIDGYEGKCHVERKSLEDAHSTILSYGERNKRFERELETLAAMEAAAVVLETSVDELLTTVQQYGKRSASENRKTLFRQILAWQQDYRVPWFFAGSRQLAEHATFRVLERYWRKHEKADKAAERKIKKQDPKVAELIASL